MKNAYVRARRRGDQRTDLGRGLAVQVYESASRDMDRRLTALMRRHRKQIEGSLPFEFLTARGDSPRRIATPSA